jgi:hypothetical protein
MVASGGNGVAQMAQECVARVSFGCRMLPYTLDNSPPLTGEGRMPAAAAAVGDPGMEFEGFFTGDEGREAVADAMCEDIRLEILEDRERG